MELNINGDITSDDMACVYEYYEMSYTSPKQIRDKLSNISKDEEIIINMSSGGGYVVSGSEIYTMLKEIPNKKTCNITGMCASIATIISMACDVVNISPTALYMIHNASGGAYGGYQEMELEAQVLKNINEMIAGVYEERTGLEKSVLSDYMHKETWFTPVQAVELGFADNVMFKENVINSYSMCINNVNMVEKMKEVMEKDKRNIIDEKEKEKELNKLKLRATVEIIKLKNSI